MYINNFNNSGFNMNSPIIQNTFGVSGYNPMSMAQQQNPNLGYPMQTPIVGGTFNEFKDSQNGYIDPNMRQNNQQTFSPFVGVQQNPMGFDYNSMPNSPFYNNLYTNYYNPYMAQYQQQQQAQLQAIEYKQRAEMESRIWKSISRGLNAISEHPIENIEEHLKQYDPVDPDEYRKRMSAKEEIQLKVKLVNANDEVICDPISAGYYETERQLRQYYQYNYYSNETQKTTQLVQVELYGIPYNLELARKVEYNNSMYDAAKKEFDDSMGVIAFFNNAGILVSRALTYEAMMRKQDMSLQYNQQMFKNRLLDGQTVQDKYYAQTFSMPPEYSGIYPGPTLGSLEITVPNRLRNKYEERRAQFLNAILSQ